MCGRASCAHLQVDLPAATLLAQADRDLYRAAMQAALRRCSGLSLVEDSAEDLLLLDEGRVGGVRTGSGRTLRARAVVLTTGTLLPPAVSAASSLMMAAETTTFPVWSTDAPIHAPATESERPTASAK